LTGTTFVKKKRNWPGPNFFCNYHECSPPWTTTLAARPSRMQWRPKWWCPAFHRLVPWYNYLRVWIPMCFCFNFCDICRLIQIPMWYFILLQKCAFAGFFPCQKR
jgi:hypothetical protein